MARNMFYVEISTTTLRDQSIEFIGDLTGPKFAMMFTQNDKSSNYITQGPRS
jgi:hypothetical protein